jgi:hypothetical protein
MDYKPLIRSILLSLGRSCTEKEFRNAYFGMEGESFSTILGKVGMSFFDFMKSIPDVCRVWKNGDTIEITRVSTEESSHMDALTIVPKKKAGVKLKVGNANRLTNSFLCRKKSFIL